ncbi:IS110 family transposase [candidate division KSB1 bacterium]|nr:IS110 family transposase [candidate division KSB1 bacterium]RQW06660.1 MAG: IS110 family transposase [candidate division KSB1 bacterium]
MYSSKKDYTGQDLFIGIDTHARQWKITIRTRNTILRTLSINPKPKDLLTFLHNQYPGAHYSSVYEAGFCGFWIHRQLLDYGIHNIVVNAADVPVMHKEKDRKDDKIDSSKLARELSKDNLIAIYVPAEQQQQLRSLCRVRFKIMQNMTRVRNRIKSHLYFNGIDMPSRSETNHWSARFIAWLESIEFSHQPGKDCLELYIEELKEHRARLLKITRLLRHYAQQAHLSPIFELLYSVPGVGFVTAVTFITEIMDIARFQTFDQLASFVGLVPSTSSSDEKKTEKGITKRRNCYLRHLIVESAWVAIRKDPVLLAKYDNLCRYMKKQEAIIRIAKKLLSRIRCVWLNRQPYVIGVD